MVPSTRRAFLRRTGAALAVATAGCGGSLPGEPTTETASRRYPENVELTPESYELRAPVGDPVAWFSPLSDRRGVLDEPTEETADASRTPAPPENAERRGLIADEETAATVGFADVDGADDARRFVEETDFERETIYLEQRRVGECYRLELCYVAWSETEVRTQYGRYYRDADVSCEVDDEDTAIQLIRIPDALDPGRVNSRGSGMSSRGCRYPPSLRGATAEESGGEER